MSPCCADERCCLATVLFWPPSGHRSGRRQTDLVPWGFTCSAGIHFLLCRNYCCDVRIYFDDPLCQTPGQVRLVHTPEQRVAASTSRRYSFGVRLTIALADARPGTPMSFMFTHVAPGRSLGVVQPLGSPHARIR